MCLRMHLVLTCRYPRLASERASERARARRKDGNCQSVNQFACHLSLTFQNTSTQDTADSKEVHLCPQTGALVMRMQTNKVP
jgi:hypothetical protein